MCSCDSSPPSIYRSEMRKARKAHRCCECTRPIAPGDSYQYVHGLWDGEWNDYATCANCVVLWKLLGGDGCHEQLYECWNDCDHFEATTVEEIRAVGWASGVEYERRLREDDWMWQRIRAARAKRAELEVT